MQDNRHTDPSAISNAARFVNAMTCKLLRTERGIHAETAIASLARMAGTSMLRSFALPMQSIAPGMALFSEQANEMGPALADRLLQRLRQHGYSTADDFLERDAMTTSPSMLSLTDTQQRLDPYYRAYCDEHQLSLSDMAHASAVACADLIHECHAVIELRTAVAIAMYGLVEGAKTVPLPWTAPSTTPASAAGAPSKKRPWYKPW